MTNYIPKNKSYKVTLGDKPYKLNKSYKLNLIDKSYKLTLKNLTN